MACLEVRCGAAVLFDLDGVLVDSRAAITGAINHALGSNGLVQHDPAALQRFIGPPLAVAFAELTLQAPDSALVRACVGSYRERYAATSLTQTTVVPGIVAVLGELAARYRLAVATSKPLAFAKPLLAALGLGGFFEVVAGPDLSVHGEDKAATVGSALAALGVQRAVMVGDRSFDIAGAHVHRLPAIGATWGVGSTEELLCAGADVVIDYPAALPATAGRFLEPKGEHCLAAADL